MRVVLAGWLAVSLAGCASGDGYGVDLTLEIAPSVTDDSLARVSALEFDVGGAEKSVVTRVPGRPLARHERIVYRPQVPGGLIEFTIIARDSQLASIALGQSWIMLKPDAAVPATITLTGDLLRASEPVHDFGTTGLGQLVSATLMLTNIGREPTDSLTVTASGDAFTITNDECGMQKLAAGQTCNLTVAFLPVTDGNQHGALGFSDGTRSAQIELIGVGMAGVAGSPAVLALAPAVDFGNVAAGSNATKMVTVTNVGGTTSDALTTTQTGDAAVFVVGGDCAGATLRPMGTCTLALQFAPTAAGKQTSMLTVSDGTASATSALAGIGTVTHQVHVTIQGTGSVSAIGLTCTATSCTGSYDEGASAPSLTLSASPDISTTFTGWSGDCTGSASSCVVDVTHDLSITATFAIKQIQVTTSVVSKNGKTGTIVLMPAGTSCGANCFAFDYNTAVTITGNPGSGSWLQSWGGGSCIGNMPCALTLTSNVTVTATFNTPVNYMFTTSTTVVPGNLGGLAGADAICGQRATAAHLAGKYVALLSTASVSALSRLGTAGGWIRVDGLPFANTTAALFPSNTNGQVFYPPRIDEMGKDIVNGEVVTGTTEKGVGTATYDCTAFTVSDANAYVASGNPTAGSVGWVDTSYRPCSFNTFRLYCFGTDFAATATPPAATGRIAFLGSTTFTPSTGVSGANTLCKNDATAAGLSGTFAALLSTTTTAAASNFSSTGTTWVRRDGVQVAATAADLLHGKLMAPITQLANGTYGGYGLGVWTGSTAPDALGGAYTCNDWTSATASYEGMFGTMESGLFWFNNYHTGCASPTWSVYCLQQ